MMEIESVDPFIVKFIRESNLIEGITRDPIEVEIEEYQRFMALAEVSIKDIEYFVSVYQPGAQLRDRPGMDVAIAGYLPIAGSVVVKTMLMDILADACVARSEFEMWSKERVECAFVLHKRYEKLHPFMDGNGRSGRMLWMWMMEEAPLGFLHTWYYQTLAVERG